MTQLSQVDNNYCMSIVILWKAVVKIPAAVVALYDRGESIIPHTTFL